VSEKKTYRPIISTCVVWIKQQHESVECFFPFWNQTSCTAPGKLDLIMIFLDRSNIVWYLKLWLTIGSTRGSTCAEEHQVCCDHTIWNLPISAQQTRLVSAAKRIL
jgi:hypothetical protein